MLSNSTRQPLLTTRIQFSYFVSTLLIYRTYVCTIVRASLSRVLDVKEGGAMPPSVSAATPNAAPTGAPGSQTLARGLAALQLVAASRNGLTVQQVADDIGVHRMIAYRLL